MLCEVNEDDIVYTGKGVKLKVLALGKHGQDCSIRMVIYVNEEPTFDHPPGVIWTMEEQLFLKKFYPSRLKNATV